MRRWLGRERVVAADLFALAIIMVVALIAMAERQDTAAASAWRQGAPPTSPYTVSTLDGARLMLLDDAGRTSLRLDCAGGGAGGAVVVTFATEPQGGTGARVVATAPSCAAGLPPGWGGDLLDRLVVGDRVWFTLQAPGERLEQRETLLYMMGTDGRLRPGAGSVWR